MPELPTRLSGLQVGGTALLALVGSVVLYVAGGSYYTGSVQTQSTLSGAQLAVQGLDGQSYIGEKFAVNRLTTRNGAKFTTTGSGSFTAGLEVLGTYSGSAVNAGGGKFAITAAGLTTISAPGTLTVKGALSGTTLTLNVAAAGVSSTDSLRFPCYKSTGILGYAIRSATGWIQSVCN